MRYGKEMIAPTYVQGKFNNFQTFDVVSPNVYIKDFFRIININSLPTDVYLKYGKFYNKLYEMAFWKKNRYSSSMSCSQPETT